MPINGINCTVLVGSCDKYEQLWDPFFELMKVYWPDCPYPVVLNTETKSYSHPQIPVKTLSLYKGERPVQWGRRLIDTLKNIDTEYVIFTLDDFFLGGRVDQSEIEKRIGDMDQNRNIGAFQFSSAANVQYDEMNVKNPDYVESSQYPGYHIKENMKCVAIPALWRRKTLIKYIRPHESPWGWEQWGSLRSKRYNEEIYDEMPEHGPIFPIAFNTDGYAASAVLNGKWLVEFVDGFFKKHGIVVDYSKLGTITLEEYKKKTHFYVITRMSPWKIIKKSIGVIRSLI